MKNRFARAIARKPGKNLAQGLTTVRGETPNYAQIIQQHAAYVETLRFSGLDVRVLEPLADHPDAYFVEDTAVVTPEVAVITNPGAVPRRGEEKSIAVILSQYLPIRKIQTPGNLDGGDVLIAENNVFIGASARSNQPGAEQLSCILSEHGYSCAIVPVIEGLHLKSSVNYIGENALLMTQAYANFPEFERYDRIIVDDEEAYACNALYINEHLIIPKGFPKTKKKLKHLNYEIIELDMSEVRKMDGGLTCLSIRFHSQRHK
ncbi:dimethylarginine dimethylaminohydrolase family protein [Thermodesulfobacteriota bacterium]